MVKQKLDIRALLAKIGRLELVLESASKLSHSAGLQVPLLETSLPYYVVRSEEMLALRSRLEDALSDKPRRIARDEREVSREQADIKPSEVFELVIPVLPDRNLRGNATLRAATKAMLFRNRELEAESKNSVVNALSIWAQDEPFYTRPIALETVIYWGTSVHGSHGIKQDLALDWDGAVATLKPFLDALTELKVWRDDSLIVDGRLKQSIDPDGRGFVRMRMWEIDADGHE